MVPIRFPISLIHQASNDVRVVTRESHASDLQINMHARQYLKLYCEAFQELLFLTILAVIEKLYSALMLLRQRFPQTGHS